MKQYAAIAVILITVLALVELIFDVIADQISAVIISIYLISVLYLSWTAFRSK